MSLLAVGGHMQTLVWMLVKISVLQAAGAVVYAVFGRHGSAATRHLIWAITVVGLLLLPMLAAVLPRWHVPLRLIVTPSTDAAAIVERAEPAPSVLTGNDNVVSSSAATPARSARTASVATWISWSTALPVLYLAGVLLLLARAPLLWFAFSLQDYTQWMSGAGNNPTFRADPKPSAAWLSWD